MKIYKVFELSRGVKERLTKDDILDIEDAFEFGIVDKYQMKKVGQRILQGGDPEVAFYQITYNGCDNDEVGSYPTKYCDITNNPCKPSDILEITIKKSTNIPSAEFNSDMKKLKLRLLKLGFESEGHSASNYDRTSTYFLYVYKLMFKTKKRLK